MSGTNPISVPEIIVDEASATPAFRIHLVTQAISFSPNELATRTGERRGARGAMSWETSPTAKLLSNTSCLTLLQFPYSAMSTF